MRKERSRVQSFSVKMGNTSRHEVVTVLSNVSCITVHLTFHQDSPRIELVIVWNPKSLKKPLSVLTSLPSLNSETSLTFSPDGQYLLTGTAGSKAGVLPGNQQESKAAELEKELGQRMGEIVVIKVDTEKGEMEIRERIEISEFSVVKVIWHERINQVSLTPLLSLDRSQSDSFLA